MKHNHGIIIFAENNEQINYVDIAIANAYMIRTHMNTSVTLITDAPVQNRIFDKVIQIPKSKEQIKSFIGYGKYEKLTYFNSNRTLAYDLSPYEETIMLDADYLILDDTLNFCWGTDEELMMNTKSCDLFGNDLSLRERRLFDTNIPMTWATVVYFKKTERPRIFFNLVRHIQNNYGYFMSMFNAPVSIYRNDFVFSIASHLMSDCNLSIKSLPDDILLTSPPADKIMKVSKGKIDLVSKVDEWHYPVQMTQSFHYMNKFDLADNAIAIIEQYT